MRRFKNILLICDEESVNEEVIGRAIWLAKANGASVTLVDLVLSGPGELGQLFGALSGMRGFDVEHEVLEFHRTRLAEIGAPIKSEGIETTETVLQGIPFVQVIRKVLRDGHDLVIKGASGDRDRNSFLFGSTDLHLLRKCPCPVWIMKKSNRKKYARILAAVDPRSAEEQHVALNTLIMDLATSLSKMDGSELHVVNAWRLDEEDTLRHSGFANISDAEVDRLVAEKRRECERELDGLLGRYPEDGGDRNVHLLKGAASELIPELARKTRAELIVMGTVGRTGIQGFFIGNTAEAILNQVDCSVLAVKPPGFESPVRLNGDADTAESPD